LYLGIKNSVDSQAPISREYIGGNETALVPHRFFLKTQLKTGKQGEGKKGDT
jgi:hypothetical protein